MKPAYYEKNHEGFEGDTFLAEKVKSLIKEFNIQHIYETGSYRGWTTKRFCEFMGDGNKVCTIEIDEENYKIAKKNLEGTGAILLKGSSEKVLDSALYNYSYAHVDNNILFYLDAHFNSYCPLLDELRVISGNAITPVIVIHDFKVPGRPDLGFDEYNGQPFTWEWIKESVENIYGVDGYNIEYNSEATGAKRGVIFITPKTN